MNNWTEHQKQVWLDFWTSETGNVALSEFESLRDAEMQYALGLSNSNGSDSEMLRAISRANGADRIISYIKVSLPKKKPE